MRFVGLGFGLSIVLIYGERVKNSILPMMEMDIYLAAYKKNMQKR
jgi:hypothetical protein